jgi:hypothetical protein
VSFCIEEVKNIIVCLQKIISQEACEESKNANNLYETSIYQVMAQYLFEVSLYISYNVFRDIAYFILMFAKFLNSQNPNYCALNNCRYLLKQRSVLEESNSFITHFAEKNNVF